MQSEDIKSEIEKGLDMWVSHYNSGNAGDVAGLYTKDARFLPPSAEPLEGLKEIEQFILQLYQTGYAKISRQKAEYYSMEPNFAFASGRWSFSDDKGDVVAKIKDITIWKKEDGTWKILREMINSD